MDVSKSELLIIYISTLGMKSHQPPRVKKALEAIKAAARAPALRPDTCRRGEATRRKNKQDNSVLP